MYVFPNSEDWIWKTKGTLKTEEHGGRSGRSLEVRLPGDNVTLRNTRSTCLNNVRAYVSERVNVQWRRNNRRYDTLQVTHNAVAASLIVLLTYPTISRNVISKSSKMQLITNASVLAAYTIGENIQKIVKYATLGLLLRNAAITHYTHM